MAPDLHDCRNLCRSPCDNPIANLTKAAQHPVENLAEDQAKSASTPCNVAVTVPSYANIFAAFCASTSALVLTSSFTKNLLQQLITTYMATSKALK